MRTSDQTKIDTLIARFFSESVVRQLIKTRSPSILREYHFLARKIGLTFKGTTFRDLFDHFYDHLLTNYRSEYIYKNAIANKILLGKHSLNTSFMLQEFRVDNCKADTVVLNGTSNVYEIKTELDSLERLKRQIKAYQKVFDMVHVIAHSSQLRKIEAELHENVGLMELTAKYSIKTIREAVSSKDYVEPETIFDSLRRCEYQSIVKQCFEDVPSVPNTEIYKIYKSYFRKLEPSVAHDLMVKELKKRGDVLGLKAFVRDVPPYFKAMALKSKFSKREIAGLAKLLNSPVLN
jgi:hypothetical protein